MLLPSRSSLPVSGSWLVLLIAVVCMVSVAKSAPSALDQARNLPQLPVVTAREHGETESADFWERHAPLLRAAWKEWDELGTTTCGSSSPCLSLEEMLDPVFREALRAARTDPEQHEGTLRNLWTRVAPGVYQTQLLDPHHIDRIRQVLDAATEESGIPFRRPNGMNRYGMILDPPTIDGAVTASPLTLWAQDLVQEVVRPVGRLLFAPYFSSLENQNDQESYVFTIRYKQGQDVALKEHSDASLITLNLNLNRPGEEANYGPTNIDSKGDAHSATTNSSSLYFVDKDSSLRHNVTFAPGVAMIHRGLTRHGAYPIQGGERTNLVVWLFGPGGYVRVVPYEPLEQMTLHERWQSSTLAHDEEELFVRSSYSTEL